MNVNRARRSSIMQALGFLQFALLGGCLVGCVTQKPRVPLPISAAPANASTSTQLKNQNDSIRFASYQASAEEKMNDEKMNSAVTAGDRGDAVVREAIAPASSGESIEIFGGMLPNESLISLSDLEQLALNRNPAIRQAMAASARAGGIRTQVGLKPNPLIGYFGDEIGNGGVGGLHGGFVSQTFVRGNKLQLNRRVIEYDVRSMNWQVETRRQRVLTDLRVAFYNALTAQQRLKMAREFQQVAERGVEVSKQRVEAKVGTRPDVLQSEIQRNELELSIRESELELAASLSELAAIAGVDDLGAVALAGELDVSAPERLLESEYATILASSPLLAAAQAQVDRANANLRRQNIQATPNVVAQVGAGADDATGDAFANVQLSLPIPVHNANQGNRRAAQAEYCAAVQNVERIRLGIRRDLARTLREYQIARVSVQQYREQILPRAEETLELIQKAQAAGEFDFLRVLTARRAYFDANLEYVAAQGRLAQAGARVDGLLLTGGLENVNAYTTNDDLRGQALNGR